jgi:carbamoyl-phosphate synthase small subunit
MEVINNYKEEERLINYVTSKKVWYSRTPNPMFNVAVIDLGTKMSFIKGLNKVGCNVISFPHTFTKEQILKYKPDGLFISNGPGNPNALPEVVELVKSFIGELPMLGVCLGQQVIGLAYGIEVLKMKSGHHGCNYPVKNLKTGKVEISVQNHLYTIDRQSLKGTSLKVTHENVITNEVEGFEDSKNKVMSIEFEPFTIIDQNTEDVYQKFITLMKKHGGRKNA